MNKEDPIYQNMKIFERSSVAKITSEKEIIDLNLENSEKPFKDLIEIIDETDFEKKAINLIGGIINEDYLNWQNSLKRGELITLGYRSSQEIANQNLTIQSRLLNKLKQTEKTSCGYTYVNWSDKSRNLVYFFDLLKGAAFFALNSLSKDENNKFQISEEYSLHKNFSKGAGYIITVPSLDTDSSKLSNIEKSIEEIKTLIEDKQMIELPNELLSQIENLTNEKLNLQSFDKKHRVLIDNLPDKYQIKKPETLKLNNSARSYKTNISCNCEASNLWVSFRFSNLPNRICFHGIGAYFALCEEEQKELREKEMDKKSQLFSYRPFPFVSNELFEKINNAKSNIFISEINSNKKLVKKPLRVSEINYLIGAYLSNDPELLKPTKNLKIKNYNF